MRLFFYPPFFPSAVGSSSLSGVLDVSRKSAENAKRMAEVEARLRKFEEKQEQEQER